MAEIDRGVTGAKRQSWNKMNARALLEEIVESNPGLDKDALKHLFEAECAPYFPEIVGYWFDNNYRAHTSRQTNGTTQRKPQSAEAQSVETMAAVAARVVAIAAKLKVADLMLPSGIVVRDATADQLDEGGDAYKKLAAKLRVSGRPGARWCEVFTDEDADAALQS
jgi:hypothetical protein